MLSKKINSALNEQMNKEFFSAYSYLASMAYFEAEELLGFAKFFSFQAQEELQHAMKIFEFVHKAGGQPFMGSVAAPKADFSSPLEAFEYGLKNERKLSGDISALFELAADERN